jgi:peptide/nickel transport system permease protein
MTDMALPAPRMQVQPTRLRRLVRWLVGDLRAALAILVLLVLVVVAIASAATSSAG